MGLDEWSTRDKNRKGSRKMGISKGKGSIAKKKQSSSSSSPTQLKGFYIDRKAVVNTSNKKQTAKTVGKDVNSLKGVDLDDDELENVNTKDVEYLPFIHETPQAEYLPFLHETPQPEYLPFIDESLKAEETRDREELKLGEKNEKVRETHEGDRRWTGKVLERIQFSSWSRDGTKVPEAHVEDIYLTETQGQHGIYERLKAPISKSRERSKSRTSFSGEFGESFVKFDIEESYSETKELSAQPIESSLEDGRDAGLPPWLHSKACLEAQKHCSDLEVMLHYEILDFARFVSASDEEREIREALIASIRKVVSSLWPESKVEVFGSFATNLFLPTSDIDLCVLKTPARGDPSELHQVADLLREERGLVRKIEVIEKAFIPLVKLTERTHGVKCDISFGRNNGPSNVKLIRQYLKDFPSLMPLVLVVKCFIQQRMLNEVYRGGIGSYALLLLIVSHLQHYQSNFKHRMHSSKSQPNLGSTLIDFFMLYGSKFNYAFAGIGIKGRQYYSKKRKYVTDARQPMLFSIEDPQDEFNEIAKNSFNLVSIRRAFSHAEQNLYSWRPQDADACTPLSKILNVDGQLQERGRLFRAHQAPEFPFLSLDLGERDSEEANDDSSDETGQSGGRSRMKDRAESARASSKEKKRKEKPKSKKEKKRIREKKSRRRERRLAKHKANGGL